MLEEWKSKRKDAINLGKLINSGYGLTILLNANSDDEIRRMTGLNDSGIKALKDHYDFRRF